MSKKAYLGDAVYADHDGFGLILTTEDGYSVTNRIVLEPEVVMSLMEYLEQLKKKGGEGERESEDVR